MNKLILLATILFITSNAFCQELTLDSKSFPPGYMGESIKQVYDRIRNLYPERDQFTKTSEYKIKVKKAFDEVYFIWAMPDSIKYDADKELEIISFDRGDAYDYPYPDIMVRTGYKQISSEEKIGVTALNVQMQYQSIVAESDQLNICKSSKKLFSDSYRNELKFNLKADKAKELQGKLAVIIAVSPTLDCNNYFVDYKRVYYKASIDNRHERDIYIYGMYAKFKAAFVYNIVTGDIIKKFAAH